MVLHEGQIYKSGNQKRQIVLIRHDKVIYQELDVKDLPINPRKEVNVKDFLSWQRFALGKLGDLF